MNRKTTKSSKKPTKNVGDRIIESLTELRDALRSGTPLEKRFTVRTVEVPDPQDFRAEFGVSSYLLLFWAKS